ncbi:hypothetical protein [Paralcaligenes ginsengisoli]
MPALPQSCAILCDSASRPISDASDNSGSFKLAMALSKGSSESDSMSIFQSYALR